MSPKALVVVIEIKGTAGDLIICGVLTVSGFNSGVGPGFGFVNSVAMGNVDSKESIPAVVCHYGLRLHETGKATSKTGKNAS